MPSSLQLKLLDFGLWVVVASAVIITVSLAIGVVVGGDLITGKYILFVVGFLIFGVGSYLIQPSRPRPDHQTTTQANAGTRRHLQGVPSRGEYGFDWDSAPDLETLRNRIAGQPTRQHRVEAKIQEIGPLAEHPLPFNQRIGREYKIFVTSLVVLAFSLVMEFVGIHV